jgi:hypothetical protein
MCKGFREFNRIGTSASCTKHVVLCLAYPLHHTAVDIRQAFIKFLIDRFILCMTTCHWGQATLSSSCINSFNLDWQLALASTVLFDYSLAVLGAFSDLKVPSDSNLEIRLCNTQNFSHLKENTHFCLRLSQPQVHSAVGRIWPTEKNQWPHRESNPWPSVF